MGTLIQEIHKKYNNKKHWYKKYIKNKTTKNIDTRNTKWQKWDKYESKIKIKVMFWEGKQLKRSTETSTEGIKVKKGNN